jgi:Spy/CpxP family protein refolding chaperone
MKSSLRSWCLSSSLLVALMVGTFVSAQDKKPDAAKAGDKKAEAKKSGNRLPANFGKLDLSDDQKTKIYAVQDTYDTQIDELTAKLKSLKEKQDTEIEAVLKPEQAKQLADLRAAAKKKNEDKKAADKTKADADKKPATTPAAEPAKKVDEKKPEATKK